MKLSRKWVQEDYLDLSGISDRAIAEALINLGFPVTAMEHPGEDTVFHIEIPSHRPDCCCVTGLCRELSAGLDIPMHRLDPQLIESDTGSIFEYLDVDVPAEEVCRRFSAKMALHIVPGPSPDWMQQRLLSCGIQPVNNIVDICHYVLLETGQSVSCFDFRAVPNGCLLIRDALEGETVIGKDGTCRTLQDGMAVLSDENYQALGIAGILEGPDFSVREDTNAVVFASADYDSAYLTSACQALSLPVPPICFDSLLTVPAVTRACELVQLLSCGEPLDGTLDVLNYVPQPITLSLDVQALSRLGLTVPHAEQLLEKVEISCRDGSATIPSHRSDLQTEQELLAEVNRIFRAASFR